MELIMDKNRRLKYTGMIPGQNSEHCDRNITNVAGRKELSLFWRRLKMDTY